MPPLLIVGELGWPLFDNGRPSNSLARAKSYRVLVTSERQFLEWLGKSAPEQQAKTYTALRAHKRKSAGPPHRREPAGEGDNAFERRAVGFSVLRQRPVFLLTRAPTPARAFVLAATGFFSVSAPMRCCRRARLPSKRMTLSA